MCGFPTSCLEIQLLALVGLDVMVFKQPAPLVIRKESLTNACAVEIATVVVFLLRETLFEEAFYQSSLRQPDLN